MSSKIAWTDKSSPKLKEKYQNKWLIWKYREISRNLFVFDLAQNQKKRIQQTHVLDGEIFFFGGMNLCLFFFCFFHLPPSSSSSLCWISISSVCGFMQQRVDVYISPASLAIDRCRTHHAPSLTRTLTVKYFLSAAIEMNSISARREIRGKW